MSSVNSGTEVCGNLRVDPTANSGTNHHMPIDWNEQTFDEANVPAMDASIEVKASIITRAGATLLGAGAGGWRVRDAVNRVSRALGVTTSVSLGLCDITCSVREGMQAHAEHKNSQNANQRIARNHENPKTPKHCTQTIVLPESGVNTNKIIKIGEFLREVDGDDATRPLTVADYHNKMDALDATPALYSSALSGLASGMACAAFTFLLGGGAIEMLCAFIGAGLGQFVRRLILAHKINQLLAVVAGVAVSCVAYVGALFALSLVVPDALEHQVGYIGAMLFVIPGFPLITACLDMFMFDMRSGIERMNYAVVTILIATLVGWLLAVAFQLKPGDFATLPFTEWQLCVLRLVAAFVGVFGFSVMFNSPPRVALIAGVIGGVSDTVNLELVQFVGMPPEIGALTGALIAGLLAGVVWRATHLSRTAFTVPSIVIMIPGLYLYKAMFYMASFEVGDALAWLIRGVMIIVFLPFGLVLARAITDAHWRHTS